MNIRLPLSARNVGLRPITITIDQISCKRCLCAVWRYRYRTEIGVRFDPASVEIGPFPSDFLTSPDSSQKTGLRVNLPLPDCGLQRSTCDTYRLLNQLDGFNPQPRIAVQFTGPVDTNSLRTGIYILWLPPLTSDEKGLNQAGHITESIGFPTTRLPRRSTVSRTNPSINIAVMPSWSRTRSATRLATS